MSYPTVNYIGNKEKIVNWISSLIPDDVTSFLDVFCGGCSVGYMAKEKGLTVYANDILKINFYIAQALIENNDKIIDSRDVDSIFKGKPYEGFMFHNFTGTGRRSSMVSSVTAQSMASTWTPLAAASRRALPNSGSVASLGWRYFTSAI